MRGGLAGIGRLLAANGAIGSDAFLCVVDAASAARVVPSPRSPAVHLRPVELASYIKSKPMIVRRGDNEIEFREICALGRTARIGIGRVLREELLARGAASAVLAAGLRAVGVIYEYELTVRGAGLRRRRRWRGVFSRRVELSTADAAPRVVGEWRFYPRPA